MSRQLRVSVLTLIVSVSCFVERARAEWAEGLVRSQGAPVHSDPSEASQVLIFVPAGTGVSFEHLPCEADELWCQVRIVRSAGDGGFLVTSGWMRTTLIYLSNGVRLYGRGSVEAALPVLAAEIRAANADPLISAWLRLFLSAAGEKLGAWSSAAEPLEEIVKSDSSNRFTTLAYLALAKLNLRHDNFQAVLDVYGRLLNAFPDYTANYALCEYSPVPDSDNLCLGDNSIQKRIEATRMFLALKSAADTTIADKRALRVQKADAWYRLGQAWEAKNRIDADHIERDVIDTSKAQHCYEMAVSLAPGSNAAGKAAWRLIEFSAPYEWSGNSWDEIPDWELGKYEAFVKAYPRHELTGEAMFKVAIATWAKAGYPALWLYVYTSDREREGKELRQVFDSTLEPDERVEQHPERTQAARRLLLELVRKFPNTRSAAQAKYYVAVIDDYCLNDAQRALVSYEDFLRQYPEATSYAQSAKERLQALRAGSK